MNKFICKRCGSSNIHIQENGTQIGLYCSDCGAWIKWLGKDDRRLAELQIQNNKDKNKVLESNVDNNDFIDKLLDYVTKSEEDYYELAFKEMDKGNMQGNLVMQAQATAFQRVRYYIQHLLDNNK
jgi:predicted metalloprotease